MDPNVTKYFYDINRSKDKTNKLTTFFIINMNS